MTTFANIPAPLTLPCADPPAAISFEVLDAYDGSLAWVSEPLSHVYIYVADEQLDSLFVYLGDSILDFFSPPDGLVLPPAELAAADAKAQGQVRAMCERIDYMLEPDYGSTWKEVVKPPNFSLPCGNSVAPHYVWDDATQSGSADRRQLLEFAFDPRNRMLVSRFDPETDSWSLENPELTYNITCRPASGEIRLLALRGLYSIAEERFDAMDPDLEPHENAAGVTDLPGHREARAVVRSCAKAIRSGRLTNPTERMFGAHSFQSSIIKIDGSAENK